MRRSILALVLALAAVPACSKDPQQQKLEFMASGDRYFSESKYAEAIIAYRSAIQLDGSFGEGHRKLANSYVMSNDLANGAREYIRAADLLPDNLETQLEAGKMLLLAGMYPEAKERASKVLDREPTNVDALTLLGNSLAGMKDLDGAIATVEEAIANDPKRTLSYTNLGAIQSAKGDASAAEAAFKSAVDTAPDSADVHLALGNFYWSSRRLPDAEREFKKGLELDPKSVRGHRALATLYLALNRPDDAEPHLKAYAELAGDSASKIVLADFYLEAKKVDQAVAILQPLLEAKDGFVPAKMRLAAIEFTSGRKPQAYASVDEALQREPNNDQVLLEKARFLMTDSKPAEALALASAAVTANPRSAPAHYMRGVALQATRENDQAIDAFRQVLQLRPTAVPAQLALADLYIKRGEAAAALQFLGQTLKLQPTLGVAHYLRAKALLQMGNIPAAEAAVKLVMTTNTASADAQALLGDLQLRKREIAAARTAYTRSIEIAPQSFDALTGLVRVDLAEKRNDAALSRVQARLANKPDDVSLLTLAGNTYRATGDAKGAETAFLRVLELDATNLAAYANLTRLYMSQNRLDEALQRFRTIAEREPKAGVGAWTMIGTILSIQGKTVEANQAYEKALAYDPNAAVAANNLAWNLGQDDATLDRALQLAQASKAKLPESWEVNDTLGWIYYKKGMAGLAVGALREGVAQNPNDASLRYHLGLAQLKNGDLPGGRQNLEHALKLDAGFEGADDARRLLSENRR